MINILLTDKLKNSLNINNINPEEYLPAYNGESAGLDLYNAGENVTITHSTYSSVTRNFYESNNSVLIPTGLHLNVPKGYVALIQERGSITKTPLKVRAGVIDAGYTGEVFINCVNVGHNAYTIYKHQKLPFQIVVVKCDNHFNVVSEEEYLRLTNNSARKEGKVGSSD